MKRRFAMQVIMSHVNTDFDALASMIAAKKLYPDAQVVISNEQIIPVKQFLNIYRDTFELVTDNLVEWSEVTEVILVDTASFSRINEYTKDVNKITVYDHHTDSTSELTGDDINIEPVGAAVTLLIEKIMNRDIEISSFEATLFGLGLYGDTGSFKYPNTTIRDFKAAEFLIKNGMNLKIIQQFTDYKLTSEQQTLLNEVFSNADTFRIDGLKILVSTYEMEDYQMGLATVTNKLLDITGADTVITVVQMKKHVYIVGRVKAERITLLPLLEEFGGGGHDQAGSATVKYSNAQEVYKQVIERLNLILKPAITARDIMSRPVKTLPPETTIEEAGRLMYRYGHSGYPVVEDNELIGITTRRDLDKANHHNLGHAPIKAYMSTDVITIDPDKTIEEMQKLIIQHNIGRLPVIQDDELIGIVTRTNIIEMIHNKEKIEGLRKPFLKDLHEEMKQHLPEEIYNILNDIRKSAREADIPVYLVGGIVRDIFLKRQNDDIDIVVEGDGIHFLKRLERRLRWGHYHS
jgi:tRNA nucleotidyltransferase (CCA-adding enzyme)